MQFPLISIMSVVEEAKIQVSKLVNDSGATDEDLYGWAIDACRLVGFAASESVEILLHVKKHSSVLPKELYCIENVELRNDTSFSWDGNNKSVPNYLQIFPAKRSSRYISKHYREHQIGGSVKPMTFDLRIPPGQIRFSFYSGTVYLQYTKLPTDEQGIVMIQDEINTIKAIESYLIVNMLKSGYLSGSVPRYVYQDFKNDFDSYSGKAWRNLVFPSDSETRQMQIEKEKKFAIFKLSNQ